MLPCISGLKADLAKLKLIGFRIPLLVAPIEAKAIRGGNSFNAVAMQTVNRAGRNVNSLKLRAYLLARVYLARVRRAVCQDILEFSARVLVTEGNRVGQYIEPKPKLPRIGALQCTD